MTKILALSGSLRAGSYNTALANCAKSLAPAGLEVEVATLHGIPLYDGDLEAESGIPESVQALKARILANDGLLLVSPEYNNGVPGVMKNGIDWLSRADLKAIFGGKPTAVIGATPGGWGTLAAQLAWLPTLRTLGVALYTDQRFMLSRAQSALNADGQLVDESAKNLLLELLAGFGNFTESAKRTGR